jgi:predicted molibdopterin-dependent oxidoreductase YjgC
MPVEDSVRRPQRLVSNPKTRKSKADERNGNVDLQHTWNRRDLRRQRHPIIRRNAHIQNRHLHPL